MAKNKTEAIITLNGQQPLQVLKQLQDAAARISEQIDAAQEKLKNLKPNTDPYKALDATIKDLKKQYDLLASAQIKDISANERLQSVVDQLSNTSLRNLRRALGDGKRQLEGLSEAELEQANAIREMMKTVGDQIRLLEGKYVKIREGLASIGTQSDQWLSKAISQQKDELINSYSEDVDSDVIEEVKNNKDNYSLSDIENKLAVNFARKMREKNGGKVPHVEEHEDPVLTVLNNYKAKRGNN